MYRSRQIIEHPYPEKYVTTDKHSYRGPVISSRNHSFSLSLSSIVISDPLISNNNSAAMMEFFASYYLRRCPSSWFKRLIFLRSLFRNSSRYCWTEERGARCEMYAAAWTIASGINSSAAASSAASLLSFCFPSFFSKSVCSCQLRPGTFAKAFLSPFYCLPWRNRSSWKQGSNPHGTTAQLILEIEETVISLHGRSSAFKGTLVRTHQA